MAAPPPPRDVGLVFLAGMDAEWESAVGEVGQACEALARAAARVAALPAGRMSERNRRALARSSGRAAQALGQLKRLTAGQRKQPAS